MSSPLDRLDALCAKRPRGPDADPMGTLERIATSSPQCVAEVGEDRGKSMAWGRRLAKEKRATTAAKEGEGRLSAAWGAVAASKVNQQAPDWQRERGVDSRTQLASSVIRGGLAACTAMGSRSFAQHTNMSRSTIDVDAVVLAGAARAGHSELIRESLEVVVEAIRQRQQTFPDYRHPFAMVGYVFDGTQQSVYLSNHATAKYNRSKKVGPKKSDI